MRSISYSHGSREGTSLSSFPIFDFSTTRAGPARLTSRTLTTKFPIGQSCEIRLQSSKDGSSAPIQACVKVFTARTHHSTPTDEKPSQPGRQSFWHSPWHLNSFPRPPNLPPHSGHIQFKMLETTSSVALKLLNLINAIWAS